LDGGETFTKGVQGTGKNEYTYNKNAGDNGTVEINLGDMPPGMSTVITFDVYVEKEAIGKSIRNAGTATGAYKRYDFNDSKYVDYEYEALFDDKNDALIRGQNVITYHGNGGLKDGYLPKSGYVYDSTTIPHIIKDNSVSHLRFKKTGYVFDHWNSEPDDSGVDYEVGESVMMNQHYDLYAQWASTMLNVRIPVKLLWASFTGSNDVISPEFQIINDSDLVVKVDAKLVPSLSNPVGDITLVSGTPMQGRHELMLELYGTNAAQNAITTTRRNLLLNTKFFVGYFGGQKHNTVNWTDYYESTGKFKLGGKYGGPDPANALRPEYAIEFQFEVMPPE
jgi:hypothetical protein